MRIGIIGAGRVGTALAKGWVRAGHDIVFGVTNPNDPKHSAAAAAGAGIASVGDAASHCDVVVLTVPWSAVPAAVAACGNLDGRLVIDVTNPLTAGADGIDLALGFSTSGAEEVARLAPGASVFKTMNQVGFEVMSDTSGYAAPPVMFVAGDDQGRKPMIMELVSDLGFEALDAGPLKRARLLEPYALLWIDQAYIFGMPRTSAFAFLAKQAP